MNYFLLYFVTTGEWWKSDVMEVIEDALRTGAEPNVSDAYTINGQPGDLYNCSKSGMIFFYSIYIYIYLYQNFYENKVKKQAS